MSTGTIQPSTLDGIKRLAKSIKTQQGIKHFEALNSAAKSAGFENFSHARNVLETNRSGQKKRFGVFITAYWRDRETKETGRETLTLWMDSLWGDLITPAQMQFNRGLRTFRSEGPDHLSYRNTVSSQSRARDYVCAAARNLQFMEATKLRPTGSFRVYPKGRSSNAVPGHDHTSSWYNPKTKHYLLVDEPYGRSLEDKDRSDWALKHRQNIVLTKWSGMYYPGEASMFLISDLEKGIPLEPIISALGKLPLSPIVSETWDGESMPMLPFFISPGALERHEASKKNSAESKIKGQARPRNTIVYHQTFVERPQRRPKGKMPIKSHAKVGDLLKSVMVDAYYRNGVYNRLDMVRSELDEWVMREYTSIELPNEQFSDLYYKDAASTFARSLSDDKRKQHIQSLKDVKKLVSSHYPDCAPLRCLLKKLDAAIKSMRSWAV